MKKLATLLLVASLSLSACGGKTDSKQTANETPVVDTGAKEKKGSSEWKWDMLRPNNYVPTGSDYEIGYLADYDRKDIGGFAFFGDKAANNGKRDIAYVRAISAVAARQVKGVQSIDDIESKFLVRDNSIFSTLHGVARGERYDWKIQKKEKVTINGFEFLHVIAEIEAFYGDDTKVPYEKESEGLIPYAEAYFTVVDDSKIGKNVVSIYRGYQNFTSKEINEKTQRALQQLVESFRKAPKK